MRRIGKWILVIAIALFIGWWFASAMESRNERNIEPRVTCGARSAC